MLRHEIEVCQLVGLTLDSVSQRVDQKEEHVHEKRDIFHPFDNCEKLRTARRMNDLVIAPKAVLDERFTDRFTHWLIVNDPNDRQLRVNSSDWNVFSAYLCN